MAPHLVFSLSKFIWIYFSRWNQGSLNKEFTIMPSRKRSQDGECQVLIDVTQGLAGMMGI